MAWVLSEWEIEYYRVKMLKPWWLMDAFFH
jgi:hypothetical protein